MIYTFEKLSWSRLHNSSSSADNTLLFLPNMAWAHQKLYIFDGWAWKNSCQSKQVNLKWSGQTRLHKSDLSSILRHFWHLRKISFSKFEANQFWQTTNVCGKIRKIGVNFGRLLLALRGHFAAGCIIFLQTRETPVSWAVSGGGGCQAPEKLLVEFEIRDRKPVLISFPHFCLKLITRASSSAQALLDELRTT